MQREFYRIGFFHRTCLLGLVVVEGVSNVALAWLLGKAVDLVAYRNASATTAYGLLICCTVALLFQWLSSVFAPYCVKVAYVKQTTRARNTILTALLSAPPLASHSINEGDLISRLTIDMKAVSTFYEKDVYIFMRRTCIAIAGLVFAAMINWQFALIEFAILPLIVFLNVKINASMNEHYHLISEYNGRMTNLLLGAVKGIRTIQAFCAEAFFSRKFRNILHTTREASVTNNRIVTRSSNLVELVNLMPLVIHFVAGTILICCQKITFGDFVLFGMLRGFVSHILMFMANFIPHYHRMQAAAKRLRAILTLLQKPNPILPDNKSDVRDECMIRTEGIGFSFEDKTVFYDVNLTLNLGEFVVLSGKSGSGKTTLLHVLFGMYLPCCGKIFYNRACLTDGIVNIAYVGQRPFIFSASVSENIRMGNRLATDEEIENICKALHIHEAIMRLPYQFDTPLGENSKYSLSGGELQRICIARACISCAKLIVMDEPTSALDEQNENAVLNAIASVKKDRMVFAITHSQTLMKNADRVLSLRKEKLFELSGETAANSTSPHESVEEGCS